MYGFNIFIEKKITIAQLQIAMKGIFPALNFYEWDLQENIINGEKDKQLSDSDILIEMTTLPGLFQTIAGFYRFPGEESNNNIDLFIGFKLSSLFSCKTTIDGYSYCDTDQMPDYSLMLENGKAYLIGDCYPDKSWGENDERIKNLQIKIIQEVDVSKYAYNYSPNGIKD